MGLGGDGVGECATLPDQHARNILFFRKHKHKMQHCKLLEQTREYIQVRYVDPSSEALLECLDHVVA